MLTLGSPPVALFTESLFTLTSNNTFPSPIILGVTDSSKTAGLNCVSEPPSPVDWYGISSP